MPAVYMLSGLIIGCLGFQLAVGKRPGSADVVSRSSQSSKRRFGFELGSASRRSSRRSDRRVVLVILGVASLLSIAWWLGAIVGLIGRC